MYKALKAFSALPGSERALSLNNAQIAWIYLNELREQKERNKSYADLINVLKWFINPTLSKKLEEKEKSRVDMDSEQFNEFIAVELRKQGMTEQQIEDYIKDLDKS